MKALALFALPLFMTGALADSASISKVNTQKWPTKHPTAVEEAISLNQVGTFDYLRREQSAEPLFEFAVHWSIGGSKLLQNVTLRLEYRQVACQQPQRVEQHFLTLKAGSRWSRFKISGKEYVDGGDIAAWKVSVLRDDLTLATKRSLLWRDPTYHESAVQP